MITSFIIFPTKGFLNTDYKIKSNVSTDIVVYHNGSVYFEFIMNINEIKTLPKFNSPGYYIVESKTDGLRQTIHVEDAIRLGSSALKKVYSFDDVPYIIIVMKDRIHFYDPIIESYVYSENFLCPDEIISLGTNGTLLFVTEHEKGVSISIFDTESFSLSENYEYKKIFAYSNDYKLLYLLNIKNELCLVDTTSFSEIASYKYEEDNLWLNDDRTLLYGIGDGTIFCININTGKDKQLAFENVVTITRNGYLIQKTFKLGYSYVNLSPDSNVEGTFVYCPLYSDISFEGHSPRKPFPEQFNYSYDRYVKAEEKDIISIFKERISNSPSAVQYMDIRGVDCSATIDIYPTQEGVYIIESVISKIYNGISYNKQKELLVYNPIISRQINLLWIEEGLRETKYSTFGDYQSVIKVNGLKASMVFHSDKSFLIEKGRIVESYPDINEAARHISKTIINQEKNPVIIDGKPLLETQIICKGKKKLLLHLENGYKYYERNINGEWEFKKSINLNEEKHTRAAMSSDGKYLVFSKGRNQYAIYDIDNQIEKTVLTGNFVDFDKTGSFIFSDEKRQIRIYDPKTLEWVKDLPYYYTFVSPDGKLYAKTSMICRYITKWNMKEITIGDYNDYSIKYNFPTDGNFPVDEYRLRRKELINEKQEYFESFFKREDKNDWVNNQIEFTESFIEKKQYVIIGIVGTDTILEIKLGTYLDYLNYVSFSYDNRFVGIVGKPKDNGYLKLAKIKFDEENKTLMIDDDICDMQIAKRATWTCSFTKFGLFGTYDSVPNLYLIESSALSIFNKEANNNFNMLKNNFCIPNRSLLCFSESGKYMALSIQGYEPFSLGGKGHVPSNKMYICRTDENFEEIDEWSYQGEGVSKLLPNDKYKKNLVQAGFSFDDKKIMTVTSDGVIVVRNLHLEIEEEIVDDCFPANWDMDEKTRLVLKPRITPDGIIDEYLPESCGDNEMWDPLNDVIYSADGKELKNCVNIKIRKYEVLKGTETIMKNAFHGIFMPAEGDWCYLEEIVLPSSIKSLDVDVFEQCPDLKKIIVPIGQAQRFASMLPRYKEIIIESI